MQTLEESNAALKRAVEVRREAVAEGKPSEEWYERYSEPRPAVEGSKRAVSAEPPKRIHAGSPAFMQAIEEIRETHIKKSQDYGDPNDALANIKAGADLVGIEPWRGCVIRMADKMQRIKAFCRDGSLANEGFEDALLDLASYAIIALIMFREEQSA